MLYNGIELQILKRGQQGYGFLIEEDSGFISPTDEKNIKMLNELDIVSSNKSEIIKEPYNVYAILTKYDILNRNGRKYGEKIQKREAEKYQYLVDDNRAVGEHNHPETSVIAGDRISHNITKMWWQQKSLLGELKLVLSPGYIKYGIISCQGDMVVNLLRNKIKIGISSRSVGTVKKINGIDIVQDDLEWICFDIVINPSNVGSWIVGKPEGMQQFVESENNKSNTTLLIDKCNKFLL